MKARQSHRSTELVRKTHCCGREAGVANGKLWCPSCGQHILRASDVFHAFSSHPAPAPPPEPIQVAPRRRRVANPDQGALL